MANGKPGLEPGRTLEATNASFEVASPNAEHQTSSKFENVESSREADVVDNTTANQHEVQNNEAQEKQNSEQEQQPSERERIRIQDIANQREVERTARIQAEAKSQQYEAMLRNLVNAQPRQSEEDVLAKQYKSYNASLGYPEDPKEFSDFNRNQATLAATNAAREETQRQVSQEDMNRTLRENPELATDTFLQAMVATKQVDAQRQGFTLSYSQATAIAKQEMSQRFQKETTAAVVEDDKSKNEAYVETTRGASTNRTGGQTQPGNIEKMSLAEMEQALKNAGEW